MCDLENVPRVRCWCTDGYWIKREFWGHGYGFEAAQALANYADEEMGLERYISAIQVGIPMARIELVDKRSIEQVNHASGTSFAETPTLFLEFHGNEAGLQSDITFATELLNDNGCMELAFEQDERGRNQLWELRHNLAYTYIHSAPSKRLMTTDVVVPINSLPEAINNSREKIESMNIDAGIVGHVGDGNYHILLMVDMNNPQEIAQAKELNEHVVDFALTLGGTCGEKRKSNCNNRQDCR